MFSVVSESDSVMMFGRCDSDSDCDEDSPTVEKSTTPDKDECTEPRAENSDTTANNTPPKKSVAQMMRDKKKQTALTLQWYVICVLPCPMRS